MSGEDKLRLCIRVKGNRKAIDFGQDIQLLFTYLGETASEDSHGQVAPVAPGATVTAAAPQPCPLPILP